MVYNNFMQKTNKQITAPDTTQIQFVIFQSVLRKQKIFWIPCTPDESNRQCTIKWICNNTWFSLWKKCNIIFITMQFACPVARLACALSFGYIVGKLQSCHSNNPCGRQQSSPGRLKCGCRKGTRCLLLCTIRKQILWLGISHSLT